MERTVDVIEQQEVMTIADLARRHDISLRTLRFYEQVGLIDCVRVGNKRLYSAKDEIRLKLIICGKKLGFSLLEIAKLISAHQTEKHIVPSTMFALLDRAKIEQQLAVLEAQREELSAAINDLVAALI